MMYLLDTNILAETRRRAPNRGVVTFFTEVPEPSFFLSTLTVGEIAKGIYRLTDDAKRTQLEIWLAEALLPRFEGRILSVDTQVAQLWGELSGNSEKQGRSLAVIDALLAATALRHHLTLVTRNTSDVEDLGVPLLNPWQ